MKPARTLLRLCLPPSAGLALVLAGCGDPVPAPPAGGGAAKPLTKIILQTDWYAQPEHGGFYQALVKGYYREAGLDVQIDQGGPNSLVSQKIAMGQVQMGIGRSDDLIVQAARGIPVVMVGALMQRDPQALMFHPESGIRGFKDLDGRTVMAVPYSNWIVVVQKKYGIRFSVLPHDFGLSRFVADPGFVQQCFITSEPFHLAKQGVIAATLLLAGGGFSPYRVWFTSRIFLEQNPAAVSAFTAASIRGWKEYLAGDRAEADRLIGTLNKQMTPELIAFSVGAMRDNHLVAGEAAQGEAVGLVTAARIQEQIDQLAAVGVLDHPVRVADVFDDRFLPDDLRPRTPAP